MNKSLLGLLIAASHPDWKEVFSDNDDRNQFCTCTQYLVTISLYCSYALYSRAGVSPKSMSTMNAGYLSPMNEVAAFSAISRICTTSLSFNSNEAEAVFSLRFWGNTGLVVSTSTISEYEIHLKFSSARNGEYIHALC